MKSMRRCESAGELRRVKEALADTHMALALEQAFLAVACEELDQSLEAFKKKHAGGRRTRRSTPHPELKVLRVCELAHMTPQNYYARRTTWRRQTVDVALLLELVRAERKYQPRLGGRKLYYLMQVELKAAGVKTGPGSAL